MQRTLRELYEVKHFSSSDVIQNMTGRCSSCGRRVPWRLEAHPSAAAAAIAHGARGSVGLRWTPMEKVKVVLAAASDAEAEAVRAAGFAAARLVMMVRATAA